MEIGWLNHKLLVLTFKELILFHTRISLPEFRSRVPSRDHMKSPISWELRCNRNRTESFSLRSRGLIHMF
ncbi:MAG: hypothetical protein QG610_1206 [Euryarchaeota archaeon]|nr:hypothetical protein [Euryarchaeota archaeon]